MSETEWFCGVQLGGVKLPAEFPAARNSKSMVHAGTGRWRQKNGRPMLIVGSRLAVYRMAVIEVALSGVCTLGVWGYEGWGGGGALSPTIVCSDCIR